MSKKMNQAELNPLLLVMCTGNVCRSPMAEAIFKHYIGVYGLAADVISRGLAAPVGRAPHPYALAVAHENGMPISEEKRADGVTSAEMGAATAVFIMDSGHRREIQRRFPTATGKTFLLGQWQGIEIEDPINRPASDFETAWRQCDAGAKIWIERLGEAGMLLVKDARSF